MHQITTRRRPNMAKPTRAMTPYDASRALAPEPAVFVTETSADGGVDGDSLAFERLRALNAARESCALSVASTARDGVRAYERYVGVVTDAFAALETREGDDEGDQAHGLRWRSSLEDRASVKSYATPGLAGERAMALFGYGGCLRRVAIEAIEGCNSGGGALGETRANEANSALRSAAGVYEYLAKNALPRESLSAERANELTSSMSEVMGFVSLGDAQGIVCARASERWDGENPAAHFRLLARLHAGASELYGRADAVLQGSRRDWNGIDIRLLACVLFGRASHECEAHLAHAESLRGETTAGQAVAACVRAGEALKSCDQASTEYAHWATRHAELRERWLALSEVISKENEVVYFEKVPQTGPSLPASTVVVKPVPYEPSAAGKHSFFLS